MATHEEEHEEQHEIKTEEQTEPETEPEPEEQESVELEEHKQVEIKPTEVLTLERLDTTVEEEDESHRITLSTDVEIKGPAGINAEPLVPKFNLDD